jgi:hypothetical protein
VTRDPCEGDAGGTAGDQTLFEFDEDDDLGRIARIIHSTGYPPGKRRDDAWTIEACGAVVRIHPGRRWRAVETVSGDPSAVTAARLSSIHLVHAQGASKPADPIL